MLTIRHATPAELEEPVGFTVTDPVGSVDADRLRREAAAGRCRPEWTWFAVDGADGADPDDPWTGDGESRVVARAVWWGRADGERPVALDCLHVLPDVPDRAGLAAELLSRGHAAFDATPEYLLVLRPGWRGEDRRGDDSAVVDAVAWRAEAAAAAGLTDVAERLQLEWTPAAGVPAASTRLVFRPADDDAFFAAFRRVAVGSLDVATRRDLQAVGADAQARNELEFLRSCPGERAWWRLAQTPRGDLAGFVIPSATPYARNVGYLGVVPELRGRGYVDDLLGEITRVHAADGAERITATTDVVNAPMAAAFERAGYRVTEVRTVFSAPTR